MPKKYTIIDELIIKVPRFEEAEGFYSSEKSTSIMSKIKSKNTKAEIKLRKTLFSLGYRYRVNNKTIKGKPDIVFLKKKVIVFIDGDFWHGYNWEERKTKIKTNRDYWIPKIERNIQRDRENNTILASEGWKVLRLWEHEINKDINGCVQRVIKLI